MCIYVRMLIRNSMRCCIYDPYTVCSEGAYFDCIYVSPLYIISQVEHIYEFKICIYDVISAT